MFKILVGFPVLFILLLSIFLLTGTIIASATISGAVEIDLCCDGDNTGQAAPSNEGECNDPGCRCLACTFSTLETYQLPANATQQLQDQLWFLVFSSPSDYIRPIDYPPEQL